MTVQAFNDFHGYAWLSENGRNMAWAFADDYAKHELAAQVEQLATLRHALHQLIEDWEQRARELPMIAGAYIGCAADVRGLLARVGSQPDSTTPVPQPTPDGDQH